MSDFADLTDLLSRPFFFCGLGGSGMLPLAQILQARGTQVEGSDRSYDQGRTPDKFAQLTRQGFVLWPQDGTGVRSPEQVLVTSAAVEGTVPEVVRAAELGCLRMSRAELNAALFNAADLGIAVAGTSGKSTVTGMLGWILHVAGRSPTVMNGAVMKNFITAERPHASSVAGSHELYVSEVDESDGSIALYRPAVGLLLNVSLDHMPMEELRELFSNYLAASEVAVVNIDDAEVLELLPAANTVLTFGISEPLAQLGIAPDSVVGTGPGQSATVIDRESGADYPLTLSMPGRHNLANALAAIAGAVGAGVEVGAAVAALGSFSGLARRFDIVGTSAAGVTVIDDFGHNPEKCAATLRTLNSQPGRVLVFFQPHGYGPLQQMGTELAQTFARELRSDDMVLMCDPVYFGGTVNRSQGAERIVRLIEEAGGRAEYMPTREECGDRLVELAQPGDRIVVMGARDDTLSGFARALLDRL
ncbi:glutamate ligase domain-containing protein [Porphyrobacter sp. GA68]|uniref:glutamate ligase domain-containing protein n=1 Tax=Porphyrobacter sp. GA68 TaxID=2883480 RepID=UPI001D184723|nr:Mur ligase family protein [Porphyrobacter sp. GA68]